MRLRSLIALGVLASALLTSCGGGGPDANGFTSGDRKAAQAALDSLEQTAIPRALIQISDTMHVPDTCTVHLEDAKRGVFRVFVSWLPHGQDLANGNGYSWLTAVVRPETPPTLRMGTIPADVPKQSALHQMQSHYGTAFDKPFENCEVLANGRLWGLPANTPTQTSGSNDVSR